MTVSSPRWSALLPAALAAFALAGCSRDGAELARVGDRVVTQAEFVDVARDKESQYPGDDATAKKGLLEDIIRRELLLQVALRRGDDTTAIARGFREKLEREVLTMGLVDELSPQAVGVSDAEVKALYEARRNVVDVSLIFTTDTGLLRLAIADLARGMPFAEVANRTNSPGMLPPAGALGPMMPGQLVPPLDAEMVKLPVGGVGGPYETPQGWFLMKVNGRQEHEQAPLATQQSMLAEAIRQRKQRQALTTRLADLRSAYHVTPAPGGGQALFELLQPSRVDEPVDLAGANRKQVLARWDGGVYTLGDAIKDLSAERERPPAAMLPALEGWIENQVMARVSLAEAKRRHIGDKPAVARQLRGRWEEFLLEGVYSTIIAEMPPASPEQARAFYDGAKSQFARLQSAHVYRLLTPDSTVAFQVARHGGHAGTLKESAAMVDPKLVVEELNVSYPNPDREWAMLEATLLRMPNGEWEGPVQTPTGWRILQLIDRTSATPSFEQLDPGLQQRIVAMASEMDRDRKLVAYSDSLRTTSRVAVNDANLARAPWPAPRIIAVGP